MDDVTAFQGHMTSTEGDRCFSSPHRIGFRAALKQSLHVSLNLRQAHLHPLRQCCSKGQPKCAFNCLITLEGDSLLFNAGYCFSRFVNAASPCQAGNLILNLFKRFFLSKISGRFIARNTFFFSVNPRLITL